MFSQGALLIPEQPFRGSDRCVYEKLEAVTGSAIHGREAPLQQLHEALARAYGGRGLLVLLEGEAGIGKSALAEAIATEAEQNGAQVTWGRAWEFAEAPPYFPLWPCMRALGMQPASGSELENGGAFELWERVLGSLARQSERNPHVWLVEDVHAADLGTLDLLTYLAQPVRAMRVLVVATLRPHDPRLDDRKLQRLARMAREGIEIRLDALDAPAIAKIAEDTLGRELPAHALLRLAELTGGNALFVVECARAFRTGGVERMLEQIPPTVRHLVLERVALLPEATRRLLDAGAILGREFAAATVARMLSATLARVIDGLLPALRAAVVRETRTGQFAFSHVMVRDAIENEIPVDARVALHLAADEALRELGERAEILIERARHALAAASRAPDQALALSHRAAEQLEREGAFDRAFELRSRVEEARAAGDLPPATALEKLHLARLARDAGRTDVMKRSCEEVIDAARASADWELFARGILLHATVVRVGVIDARQVGWFEEARAALASGSATGCRVLARLATALQPAEDATLAHSHARAALRDARALGDDDLVLDVLDLGAFGMWGAQREERCAWFEELRDIALRTNDFPRAIVAWSLLAVSYADGGELDKLATACGQVVGLADRVPHPRHRWVALLLGSGYACAVGNFAESDRYVTEVAQIAALIDDPALEVAQVGHRLARAKLRRWPDEVAAAIEPLDHALRDFKRGAQIASATRAGCYARLEDVEATRRELAWLGTQARQLAPDYDALVPLAEAYAFAGSEEDCRWVRDVLARVNEHDLLSLGVGYMYETSTERLRGLIDAALGDLQSAEERLSRAHARATAHGMRPWIAQLAHELAQVVARRGRDPRELAEQAAAIGRELGMHGFGSAPAPALAAAPVRVSRAADVWTIERGAVVARVKDSRGMQLLARLLERPGEEIHVLALASDDATSAPDSSAGEMLDDRARRAYRKRLTDLDEALAIAEQRGDANAAARLEREKEALVRELARATGLGGRARVAGSETERARVNVQRRVKEAIGRISDAEPELGAFLEVAVHTGTFCCFIP